MQLWGTLEQVPTVRPPASPRLKVGWRVPELLASSWVAVQKAATQYSAGQAARRPVVQQKDSQRSPVAGTPVAFRQVSEMLRWNPEVNTTTPLDFLAQWGSRRAGNSEAGGCETHK